MKERKILSKKKSDDLKIPKEKNDPIKLLETKWSFLLL